MLYNSIICSGLIAAASWTFALPSVKKSKPRLETQTMNVMSNNITKTNNLGDNDEYIEDTMDTNSVKSNNKKYFFSLKFNI